MLNIIPSKESISFHSQKASMILDKIINEDIGKGLLLDSTRNFIKKFKNIILRGNPHLLLEVHKKFELIRNGQDFDNLKICFRDRAYKRQFQKDYSKEFLELLQVDTCTYCNRNYTIQLVANRARAELDHWFPIESFPLFALSFYNLIPSCHSCNHIKHNNKPDGGWINALSNIKHPYIYNKDESFAFSFFYSSLTNPKVILKTVNPKVQNTIVFNKINKIYESHSNRELKDLLDLRYKYSRNYLDILLTKTFKDISISNEEVYRMIFGVETNDENFHKRPFSKFKRDIINELLM